METPIWANHDPSLRKKEGATTIESIVRKKHPDEEASRVGSDWNRNAEALLKDKTKAERDIV